MLVHVWTVKKVAVPQGGLASSWRGGRGVMSAAGGVFRSLLLVGLFLLLGGSPGQLGELLGGQEQAQLASESGEDANEPLAHCQTLEDGNTYADCRVDFKIGRAHV